MKPIALIILLFLVGCVPYVPTHPNIIVVGDSLCQATHGGTAWPVVAGIAHNCVGGRAATEFHEMPTGHDTIIFSMGRNDINKSTVEEYEAQLEYLFSTTASQVLCILPDMPDSQLPNTKLEEIRQAMIRQCPTIPIEPKALGYLFRAPDLIHGSPSDHQNLGSRIEF